MKVLKISSRFTSDSSIYDDSCLIKHLDHLIGQYHQYSPAVTKNINSNQQIKRRTEISGILKEIIFLLTWLGLI